MDYFFWLRDNYQEYKDFFYFYKCADNYPSGKYCNRFLPYSAMCLFSELMQRIADSGRRQIRIDKVKWKVKDFDQEFQKMKNRNQSEIEKFEKLSKDFVAFYLSKKSNGYKTIMSISVRDTIFALRKFVILGRQRTLGNLLLFTHVWSATFGQYNKSVWTIR